ncbi:MAG: peptidylprolyl isomerase [Mangrovibacterium sp.]
MNVKIFIIACIILFSSCQPSHNTVNRKEKKKDSTKPNRFLQFKSRIGELNSYDGNRLLETETAFFIDSNLIVSRLSPILESNKVELKTWDNKIYSCNGFVAIDRTNDIVILHSSPNPEGGIKLCSSFIDTVCAVRYPTAPRNKLMSVKTGNIYPAQNTKGALNYQSTFPMYEKTYGSPLFIHEQCIGIGFADVVDYEKVGLAIPSPLILKLLENRDAIHPFSELKSKTDKATSLTNSKIKGLIIETTMGNIAIRLFNETPEYRDNFIALVKEHYYDSLLIHRVIPGFCIQSGAADTKYAKAGDPIGWRGPGYTLPAHIVSGKFHKRGAIGSPRKPDRVNSKHRSDGSQFYIVTGRRYSDNELDLISKDTGHKFTQEQRTYYKTIGGAPHIDGSYTIFGEVISGLDIADKINQVSTNKDYRPRKDVRIKRIRIIP